jgi:hypothetical protein
MQTTYNLTRQQLENLSGIFIEESQQFKKFSFDTIQRFKRFEDKIILKSLTSKVTIHLKKIDDEMISVSLKINFLISLKILFYFVTILFLSILFLEKVTLNGDQNPSLFDKIVFVFIAFAICSIPYGILYFMKIQFLRKIENQIKEMVSIQ